MRRLFYISRLELAFLSLLFPACIERFDEGELEFQDSAAVHTAPASNPTHTATGSLSDGSTHATSETSTPIGPSSTGRSLNPTNSSRSVGFTSSTSLVSSETSLSTTGSVTTSATVSSSSSSSTISPASSTTASSTASPTGSLTSVPTDSETRSGLRTDGSSSSIPSGTSSLPESSSEDSSNTFETIPQFGLRLSLDFEDSVPSMQNARVFIATVNITQPQGAIPDMAVHRVVYDYPVFSSEQDPAVVLPTPTALVPELGRSELFMVAVYSDDNGDKRWTPNEGFVAASPSLLFYEAATAQHHERWSAWHDLTRLDSLVSAKASTLTLAPFRMSRLSDRLSMKRFDAARAQPRVGGTYGNLDPRVSFLATVAPQELSDLPKTFIAGERPLDMALRENSGVERWEISAGDLRPLAGSALASHPINIQGPDLPPGLNPAGLRALPLVAYSRPVGAPVQTPGQFLVPGSTFITGLCANGSSKQLAAVWLEAGEGPWIAQPIGALHAAALGLAPGWNFGFLEPQAESNPRLNLHSTKNTQELLVLPGLCGVPTLTTDNPSPESE